MKFLVLAALFACAIAAPSTKMVFPRLPPSILRDKKFLIPEDKIVGGSPVTANSLPFQISLQRRSLGSFSHSCGGSILTAKTILNAAHCVDGVTDMTSFLVVAGEHNLNIDSGLEQNRDVSSYKMHERYNTNTEENDIALIYLTRNLDLTVASAKAVNLPAPLNNPSVGTMLTVSGWGTTSAGGSISNVLLSVDVPVVSDSVCNEAYATIGDANPIVASMLCAGDMRNGGVDSCQGDSGGPLFSGSGATAVQHGVVSWGRGCASAAYPGVYTQVSYFIDWINNNKQ